MAITLVLVGGVFKLASPKNVLTSYRKNERIRRAGKLRRVCPQHRKYLAKGNMAVLDAPNCDWCKMMRYIGVVK